MPQVFIAHETVTETSTILPPTQSQIDLDFIVAKKSQVELGNYINCLSDIGELGKNKLIFSEIGKILQERGFVVLDNKAVIPGNQHRLSICASSRPDLMAFNPSLSAMVYVDTETESDSESELDGNMGEASKERKLKGAAVECKDDFVDPNTQQLLGGIDKTLGSLVGQSFLLEPPFTLVDIYALSVGHDAQEAIARKITVDYKSHCSLITRGRDKLGIEEAASRLITVLQQ